MKKLFKLLSIIGLSLMFLVGCSSVKSTMKSITSVFKDPVKYNNVTATFVTTQGEITFYLYPEAAPITVANFINLAKEVSMITQNSIVQLKTSWYKVETLLEQEWVDQDILYLMNSLNG